MTLALKDFATIRDEVYRKLGLYFEDSKVYFIQKRIEKRMETLGVESFADYGFLLRFGDKEGKETAGAGQPGHDQRDLHVPGVRTTPGVRRPLPAHDTQASRRSQRPAAADLVRGLFLGRGALYLGDNPQGGHARRQRVGHQDQSHGH